MATWPATLPNPLVTDYGIQPVDQTIRSDMEFGTARVRRRSAQKISNVPVSWEFSDAQFATFKTWFYGDCKGGAAWFNGLSLAMGDTGLTTPDCQFIGTYQESLVSGALRHKISAKLEVRA